MAMCVIAVVGAAPCQCFSPGAIDTTSPGRISSIGPPARATRPAPAITISVWPSGCVCQAVRAPGSNVTLAPCTNAGSGATNNGSMRTAPVNQSEGPLAEACEPTRLISIVLTPKSNSTPHQFLQLFRIPRPLHRDLRRGGLQFPEITCRKLNIESADIFFKPMQL